MSYFQFNKIIVIESLEDKDRKTGREVFDDLEFTKLLCSNRLESEFRLISNKSDLMLCIDELIENVEFNGVFPILQIDAHGNTDGVKFSENSYIGWRELLEQLSKLNLLMKGNLLVVLASCYGAHIIRHVSTISRAPFWGVIAPYEKTHPENVYSGLNRFYNAICLGNGSSEIVSTLNTNRSSSDLKLFTAELLFVKATEVGVSQFQARKSLDQQIKSTMDKLSSQGEAIEITASQLKMDFISEQMKKFEDDLKKFLMVDLFPENENKISKIHNPWSL